MVKTPNWLKVKPVQYMGYLGNDCGGWPDQAYVKSRNKHDPLANNPPFPIHDTLSDSGEQAVLVLPYSVQKTRQIREPLLNRFPNHLLIGSRRDIVSPDPLKSFTMLSDLEHSVYNEVEKRNIPKENLTVVGICAGAACAAAVANYLRAENVYLLLAAGRIADGIWTSNATKEEVAAAQQEGITKEQYGTILKRFDPLENVLTSQAKNIYGIFSSEDKMVPRSAWEPLAQAIHDRNPNNLLIYENIGHCAGMFRATRDLKRGIL